MTIESEQKIRDLLKEALAAKDAQEVDHVLGRLRKALEEHVRHAKISLGTQVSLIGTDLPPKKSDPNG